MLTDLILNHPLSIWLRLEMMLAFGISYGIERFAVSSRRKIRSEGLQGFKPRGNEYATKVTNLVQGMTDSHIDAPEPRILRPRGLRKKAPSLDMVLLGYN